jgi:nitrite reductase/ring-hydroxylating ferredoxin subunit
MTWYEVCHINELPEGARQVFTVGQHEILIIHHGGRLYACDNLCPHLNMPLQTGQIDEELVLRCPWHHSAFDLHNGEVHAWSPWPPGVGRVLGRLSPEAPLPTYPIKTEDDHIWVAVESP